MEAKDYYMTKFEFSDLSNKDLNNIESMSSLVGQYVTFFLIFFI